MSTVTPPRPATWDKDELKRLIRLRDLVETCGVTLRRDGAGRWKALCPFHEERTPSFTVYDADDRFKCFGCGRAGDIFSFLWYLRREWCPLKDAFPLLGDELARLAGVLHGDGSGLPATAAFPLPEQHATERPPHWEALTDDELLTLELATGRYQRGLWASAPARAYLRGRGIPWWAVRDLRLGYAAGRALAEHLAGYDGGRLLPVARALGLLPRRANGTDRDHLAGRVVVPELRGGRPIWLMGRALPVQSAAAGTRHPTPKYLALAGPKPLLGLDCLAGRPEVLVCEGTLDWVTLRAWGHPACCTSGAASLATAIATLHDLPHSPRVWGVFDDDDAGNRAASRLGAALGARFRRLALPAGLDPNDLARRPYGSAVFAALLVAARREAGVTP